MLQDGTATPPLSAAEHLRIAQADVPRCATKKTKKWLFSSYFWRAAVQPRCDAVFGQCLGERLMDHPVQPPRQFVITRSCRPRQRVGQFAVVDNGTAARMTPDDRASAAGSVRCSLGPGLEITKRKRRLLPAIQPQAWRCAAPLR